MKVLIIYDNEGYILQVLDSNYRIPVGVPYLIVDVPEGKSIKGIGTVGVDVTTTPHKIILEDIPPTEIDTLKQQVQTLSQTVAQMQVK